MGASQYDKFYLLNSTTPPYPWFREHHNAAPPLTTTPWRRLPRPSRQPVFATTHWTVVPLTAGRSETTHASAALERLCQTYWYPLYGYVRRCGHSPEDGQDLTQAFFARLLERQWIGRADREKGKFRSFLLSALKHFLADEWDRARAQKRGGGLTPLPLQFDTAETRYGHTSLPDVNSTPRSNFMNGAGLWRYSRKSCRRLRPRI